MLSARARNVAFAALVGYARLCPAATKLAAQTEADCEHDPAAQKFEKEERAEKARLADMSGAGTDQKLRAGLLAMRKVDQDVRARMFASPGAENTVIPELQKTDATLSERLKQIVATHGWPTIALVGIEASQTAALILVHSPDRDFQRRLIPELQQLVEEKKIVGSDIAMLIDKTMVAEGRPQRFGTQFSWKNAGPMVMDPVEDPDHLDERRKTYLLPPVDVYKCFLAAVYHRKVQ
jgi:hypothetical protein